VRRCEQRKKKDKQFKMGRLTCQARRGKGPRGLKKKVWKGTMRHQGPDALKKNDHKTQTETPGENGRIEEVEFGGSSRVTGEREKASAPPRGKK